MKRSTHTTAASSWRACAADSSAISWALPPVTQPPHEKPTIVAATTDPAQAQKSTVLLAWYCWKRCDRVWFWRCSMATSLGGLPRTEADCLGSSPTPAVGCRAPRRADPEDLCAGGARRPPGVLDCQS